MFCQKFPSEYLREYYFMLIFPVHRIALYLCLKDSPLSVYSKKSFIIRSFTLGKSFLQSVLLYPHFTFNLLELILIFVLKLFSSFKSILMLGLSQHITSPCRIFCGLLLRAYLHNIKTTTPGFEICPERQLTTAACFAIAKFSLTHHNSLPAALMGTWQ